VPAWAQPASAPAPAAAAERRAPSGAPATLVIWNRPIVVLRVTIRQTTPAQRVAAAAQRFQALPDDLRPEEIAVTPATVGELHGVLVTARGQIIFGIADQDIDVATGDTLELVSQRALEGLRSVVQARADQRRLPTLIRGVGLALAATVLFGLVLWGIARLMDSALARLVRITQARAASRFGVDVWTLLDKLRRAAVRLTAWGLGLIAAYLWLTFVLHQFPYTLPWSQRLGGYIVGLLTELGSSAVGALPGLFAVVVIFVAARFVVGLVDVFFRSVEEGKITLRHFEADTARATRRIIVVLIWIFALTVAYEYIPGSDTDAFKAIGVFAGLVISLGSGGLVSQMMSGLVVIYARALRPGELVQAGDTVGLVREVNLLSTKLVTARREEVTIPNGALASMMVTNYSRLAGDQGAVIGASVTIGYDQPWRQVHALLLLAAERTPGTRKEPKPYVLQRALADFYVTYEVRVHLDVPEARFLVLSELHAQIQDAFNEFGVQIMSPAFEAQPEKAVVVPRHRWFSAPASPGAPGQAAPAPAPAPNPPAEAPG
jgi:small-conductance mechanosensitive channel